MTNDDFDLNRFVRAQEDIYPVALRELRAGAKRSHWMWFIFPQVAGLGSSSTARFYAIGSRAEALAYLVHPVLGRRLEACTRAVQGLEGSSAVQIFGGVDAMKFRSSMTLFAELAGPASIYRAALDKYFSGAADPRTLDLLDST